MSEKRLPGMNRRQFLNVMGLSAAMAAAAKVGALDATTRTWLQADNQSSTTSPQTEEEVLRKIRARLEPLFQDRAMGLDFRRINEKGETDFTIHINEDAYFPVASAFKGFLILYYFLFTPDDEWQAGPTDPVYRVAVHSNNTLTGTLLHEVGERIEGEGNAIEKFNDFITGELGMKYGIYTWSWPGTITRGLLDQRYAPRKEWAVKVRSGSSLAENVSTPKDLATGWSYIATAEANPRWSDPHFQKAILATREILSIPAVSYRSPIERELYGGYIGKDGTLPQGDFPLGRVIDDAGLVRVPDGFYIISFMSTGETEQTTSPALSEVVASVNVYQDFLHPYRENVITGAGYPLVMGELNYGFVRTNSIPLYLEPNSQAEHVDNPTRRTSVYGTPYLMRGALLRVMPVDDNWGEVIVDNREDDVFTYLDWTYAFQPANWSGWDIPTRRKVYVPLENLKFITPEQTSPIEYANNYDDKAPLKWLMLHVPKRQLTLFEGLNPIIKTPIVLNSLATPRGRLYVNRVMVARNMPTYPGVPYTNFLHNGSDLNEIGYAIHGAPWHIWEETVTEWETIRRFSHGCINIPNWKMPIGKYELPVDEFIFRWIGGFPNPGGPDTSYFKKDTVRVMSVNNPYEDLFYYSVIDAVQLEGGNWNHALRAWEDKQVDAPERFFVNPYNRENNNILNLQAATDDE